jgi:hypothetical protein
MNFTPDVYECFGLLEDFGIVKVVEQAGYRHVLANALFEWSTETNPNP